jgi:5-formyltetrahydrofolate cyclo-ligase
LSVLSSDPARRLLRERLHAQREQFAAGSSFDPAGAALAASLAAVVCQLEPSCLGLYWSIRSEFNAVVALAARDEVNRLPWALPHAQREPRRLHYRRWNREAPAQHDECGIPTAAGAEVVPDVVLVPCVGYTREGFRLGYGGGYYDRWLAEHPHVTAIGVAWSFSELGADMLQPQAHDVPLALIVTERGVVGA